MSPTSEPATLYLVATPIGNLGDITLRALDTLRTVDAVASEDTRKTGLLLKHFDIKKPQIAFHEHNEARAGERILELLRSGRSVALVTNAGTPGISDPGFTLVRRAVEAGVAVTMIPGPTALVMALVLSGLPVHAFTFRGFPPRKPGPRRRFLAIDHDAPHTLIFYESPYRLLGLLEDALAVYGDRPAALANDLTKLFEAVDRGPLSELLARARRARLRGEYVLVIAGAPTRGARPDEREAEREQEHETEGEDEQERGVDHELERETRGRAGASLNTDCATSPSQAAPAHHRPQSAATGWSYPIARPAPQAGSPSSSQAGSPSSSQAAQAAFVAAGFQARLQAPAPRRPSPADPGEGSSAAEASGRGAGLPAPFTAPAAPPSPRGRGGRGVRSHPAEGEDDHE